MGLKPTDYVYCTKCKYLRFDDEDISYCPFEDDCDNWDCEDGRRYAERSMYELKDKEGEIIKDV